MLYTDHNLTPTHHIQYGWTGWPSEGTFRPLPHADFLSQLASAWKNDGFDLLTHVWKDDQIQFTFSALPQVSPVIFAQRVKGRLQHALRKAGTPTNFSRKVTMRSIGKNLSETVGTYVRNQLKNADLADPRYRARLAETSVSNPSVQFSEPDETNSGRYWYNLHLVLVTADRFRMGGTEFLRRLRETFLRTADHLQCPIAELFIMPDHVHVALRANLSMSPTEIGLRFQNETARVGRCRWWETDFYVGTFSEYDLTAVLRN